jgi:hypothetical protein
MICSARIAFSPIQDKFENKSRVRIPNSTRRIGTIVVFSLPKINRREANANSSERRVSVEE